jgi:hypothetical protein
VRVGARGLRATIRNLVAENDVQYSKGPRSWDIPADGYLMLGDNTDWSRDSREWNANEVVTKDGRTFVAPVQARLSEDDLSDRTVWRPRGDGGVDFVDSHGIERHLSKDEIAEIRPNVPQPFARRDDLVGRAFFVFFPFPPFGDFRPRFLR